MWSRDSISLVIANLPGSERFSHGDRFFTEGGSGHLQRKPFLAAKVVGYKELEQVLIVRSDLHYLTFCLLMAHIAFPPPIPAPNMLINSTEAGTPKCLVLCTVENSTWHMAGAQ